MATNAVTSANRCAQIVAQQQGSLAVAQTPQTCAVDERYTSSFERSKPVGAAPQQAPTEGTQNAKAFIRFLETQIAAAELILAQGRLLQPTRIRVEDQLTRARAKLAEARQKQNEEIPSLTERERAEQLKERSLTLKPYDDTIDTKSFNNVGFTREQTSKNTERLNTPDGSEIWVSLADRQYINAAINIEGKAIDLYLEGENGPTADQALQWTKNRDQAAQAEVSSDAQAIANGRDAMASILFGAGDEQPGPTAKGEQR